MPDPKKGPKTAKKIPTPTLGGEQVYTTHEVADILKLKWRTIMNLLHTGELKGAQIGRRWRIRESDVREFLERRSQRTWSARKKEVVEQDQDKEPEIIAEAVMC